VTIRMPLDDRTDERFRCEVEPRRDVVYVRPVGELDLATVPSVDARLDELHAAGFDKVVLDLSAVGFLDSTAIRLILTWDARSRADGFDFALIQGPPGVQRLFDLTGTASHLTFVDG